MAVWLVRAGRYGESEDIVLDNGVAVIGWKELSDLSTVGSKDDLEQICLQTYPDAKPKSIAASVGQLWAFRERIQIGDLVVLPLKTRAAIAAGRVTGPYQYRPDLPDGSRHTRPVDWLTKDIPRNAFDADIQLALNALMTVCKIQRDRGEELILGLIAGQRRPLGPERDRERVGTPVDNEPLNLDEYARDQIADHIGQRFRSHGLARLVTAILEAQGYKTQMSPAGPDGGVDVIAGRGPMGFDPPRLCVQVKSSDQPLDVGPLRELRGVMQSFGAEQGLLVSWGGFKRTVESEARSLFFRVRLWKDRDVVDAVLENYDRLPADVQADLPLQRIWALVPEEE